MLILRNIFLYLYLWMTVTPSLADSVFTIMDMSGGNIVKGSKVICGSNIYLRAWSKSKMHYELDFSISHECESFIKEIYHHENQEGRQEALVDLTTLLEKKSFKSLDLPKDYFIHEVTNHRVWVETINEGAIKDYFIIHGKINFKDITVVLIKIGDGIVAKNQTSMMELLVTAKPVQAHL